MSNAHRDPDPPCSPRMAHAHLEHALASIESILDGRGARAPATPRFDPADLGIVWPGSQDALGRPFAKDHPAGREHAAIHLLITASSLLLNAARQLMAEPPLHLLPPKERGQRMNALVDETKTAGRAAYRSALLLTGQE
ncbi:hypothetical protein [Variovorax fucosicus]|uniref:hypothetical protein n=1 Tax=Variovorax fucosicus TaxID=3053517 RepID=UPI0025788A3B|nr:hypothetical protein [Variovorax sp. J22G47]MDM0058447.1 hypothetical protein [Variovorax sp. J22G47]